MKHPVLLPLLGSALLLIAAGCPAAPPPAAPDSATPENVRGWNLTPNGSWGSNWLFADAIRKASGFGSGWVHDTMPGLARVDTQDIVPLRAGKRSIIVHSHAGNFAPPGQYTLTWIGNGSAQVRASGGARRVTSGPNRAVYQVGDRVDSLQVVIDGDVRNPHLWLPGAEGQIWNPAALGALQGAAVLRFMDWTQTNRAKQATWDTRPLPHSLYQGTEAGVAWEHCIDLAKAVGAQPWLNIPALADEAYCQELGRLLSTHCPPDMKVRVEFGGNEYWNTASGFKVNAKRFFDLDYTPNPRNNQGQRHPATAYAHLMARQAAALAQTFPRERTVRVVSAHTASSWWAKTTAAELKLLGCDWDELACTFYFAGLHEVDAPKLGLPAQGEAGKDVFFEKTMQQLTEGSQYKGAQAHAAIAKQHGKRLAFYEGGSHARYYGSDETIKQWYVEINRDPRMAQATALNSQEIRRRFPNAVQCYFSDAAFYDNGKVGIFGAIDGRNDQWDDDTRNGKWKAFVEATQ